ncbi:TonB-dependent receptor [Beijerinckiaceae bacterium]|nr:TonB-dependent receptor [Beijerinckiaceae bacterium]
MSSAKSLGGALALALTLACSGARAQQASPTESSGNVALPTVDVLATSSAGSLTVPSVTEQKQQIDQMVGSVDFVDANTPEIQTRHVEDLRDALKDVPGVYVETRYGQEVRLSIRGSGLTRFFHLRGIELLQDGIPVNLADGSGDFDQIDPLYFRSIEVFKGGNALIFGTSTLGGAINFVSPTAYTALAPNLILIDGGSFGSIRGQVQVSRVIGDFDFLINGTFSHSDGYRQHSQSDLEQINGNIGYRFAPWAETRFYFGVYSAQQKIPGLLDFNTAVNNPTTASVSAAFPGFGGNQARNILDERIANKTTMLTDFGRIDVDSWFIHNNLYHPIFLVLDQDGYTWGVEPRLTSKLSLGGFRDDLIVGARFFGGRQADHRFVNFDGLETIPVLNARQVALNLEAFGENRFFIAPQVALMAGAKVFSDSRRYFDLGGLAANPISSFDQKTYNGVNPKAGVIWYPLPDIQVFADITRSQDVPDFSDLTQTFSPLTPTFVPLSAQKAWTGEIGTRGRWDRFSWDFTAYRSDIHDELLQFTVNQSIPANTFNAPHTLHQGIEFAAGVEVWRDISGPAAGDALTLSQVWTWNDFSFVNDPQFGNNQLAGAPVHVLRTTLAYRRLDGLYVAPSLDWVPVGAFADYANTVRTPGYVLLGLQAGITLPAGVSLYLDARNLTNQHYISDVATVINASVPASQQIYFPGNGRAIYAGMRYKF